MLERDALSTAPGIGMSEFNANSPPDKWQFSLRTLLAVMVAIALTLGLFVQLKEWAIPIVLPLLGIGMVTVGFFYPNSRMTGWGIGTCVIGLMFCCMCPMAPPSYEPSKRGMCSNNLKQVGVALLNYQDINKTFPDRMTLAADGSPGLSWRVSILPFLEQQLLYKKFRLDQPWDSPHNIQFANARPQFYACPSAKRRLKSESDYYAIGGPDSCLPDGNALSLQEIMDGDGTSNTVMIVESHTFNATWSEPRDIDPATTSWKINAPNAPSSGHNSGAMVLFADGSTRFVTAETDPEVVKQLANRHDGLPGKDWEE
jgi:prepilin-type processing-associated H-X9-DG protein